MVLDRVGHVLTVICMLLEAFVAEVDVLLKTIELGRDLLLVVPAQSVHTNMLDGQRVGLDVARIAQTY